jgi:hypothetical protein
VRDDDGGRDVSTFNSVSSIDVLGPDIVTGMNFSKSPDANSAMNHSIYMTIE